MRQLRCGKEAKAASQDELRLMRRLVASIGTFPEFSDSMAFKIDDASRPVVVSRPTYLKLVGKQAHEPLINRV